MRKQKTITLLFIKSR